MTAEKFSYVVERVAIVFLCFWGSWALYYWVAVLIFDASYNTLKSCSPIFLLQFAAFLHYLFRIDLCSDHISNRVSVSSGSLSRRNQPIPFYILSAIAVFLMLAVIIAADHFRLTRSSTGYNIFWTTLLPFAFGYLYWYKIPKEKPYTSSLNETTNLQRTDSLLFILTAIILAFFQYGTGFPTADDAFYGHVMLSTLANPTLSVQSQDLLLGTSNPYSLHPAYRPVGFEILIALLADTFGLAPIRLYHDVLPLFGSILWSTAAYMFMRTIRTPFPGLAATTTLLVLLFLDGNSQANAFKFLFWGKSLVSTTGAPLLFFSVATYIRLQSTRAWLILFLAVCTIAIWSSTALFFVPLCVALSTIVFLPSIRGSLPVLFAIAFSLVPIFILLIYSLSVLYGAPIHASGAVGTGLLRVNGEAFGGLHIKSLLLLIILTLPLMSRSVANPRFQSNILRLCIAGFFTVMAPFFLEVIARSTGLNLLSLRLADTYPAIFLPGIIASIGLSNISNRTYLLVTLSIRYSAFFLALIALTTILGLRSTFYSPLWRIAGGLSSQKFDEAVAVRKLIPPDSYVAAGVMDDVLPILPDPPTFIGVRHYLQYHKYALSKAEFSKRKYLHTALKNLLPSGGRNLDTTLDLVVSASTTLGVSTLVFQVFESNDNSGLELERRRFVAALTDRLESVGYYCVTTPSGRTRVCNEVVSDTSSAD